MLLGVIVHSKVLGRSRHHHKHHHHHHHRHKRTHPSQHHSLEKRSKLEVGIGGITPPESPKKPPAVATLVVTSSTTTSSVMTSSVVTPTLTSLPSMYKTGENEVTSTSITHFSAGIKDSDNDATDVAYSPSDEIEKTMPEADITKNSVPVTTSEGFTAPSLSPNTMSRLQSLIQTVKDSIASLPAPSSEAMAKQDLPPLSTSQAAMKENKSDTVSTSNNSATNDNNTSSAYVFHESLPVTSSVTMVTSLPVVQQQVPPTRQHTSFYGNQEMYSSQTRAQLDHHHQSDHRYQGDHYHGKREQWVPYRSNWSPQQR